MRVNVETCELVVFSPALGIIERGFQSKRSSSRSTVWDLWKFDTHLKEIQVSRQNLCKMKFAKNVNENLTTCQCSGSDCENNQQMGEMCVPQTCCECSKPLKLSARVIYVAFPRPGGIMPRPVFVILAKSKHAYGVSCFCPCELHFIQLSFLLP